MKDKEGMIFFSKNKIYGVLLFRATDHIQYFCSPIAVLGEMDKLSVEEIGAFAKKIVDAYQQNVEKTGNISDQLEKSARNHGFKNMDSFFRRTKSVSIEQTADGYTLVPYETGRGSVIGHSPLDIEIVAGDDSVSLGKAVLECFKLTK